MFNSWFSQDIPFCSEFTCPYKECLRNAIHIIDGAIPHSFQEFKGTEECPKRKEIENEFVLDV